MDRHRPPIKWKRLTWLRDVEPRYLAPTRWGRVLDWISPTRIADRQWGELCGIAERALAERDWLRGVVVEGRRHSKTLEDRWRKKVRDYERQAAKKASP